MFSIESIIQKSGTCNCKTHDALTDYSPKDKPWDVHRAQADMVQSIYHGVDRFERLAKRISECSGVLRFEEIADAETGEISLKLRDTQFCRVRHCPVCQWRRSLMWQARFFQTMPEIVKNYPEVRWMFLTLTVRNCEVEELRKTLQDMGKAWQRFIKRKEFQGVLGWVRTTEVTRGKDGTAHPHYHVLMMVPPAMLSGRLYIKHDKWVDLWKSSMKLNYSPNVDVRAVKPRKKDTAEQALNRAVKETLKYAIKPVDMVEDEHWFLELTKQVHRLRFIATGGVLKDILREDEETEEDLLLKKENEEQEEENSDTVNFSWRRSEKQYRRKYY